MSITPIIHYLYEAYHLKNLEHCGVKWVHVPNADSLAEHVLLATQIGYFLADLEGADQDKVMRTLIFHDNAEIRIGDINKIHAHYLENYGGTDTDQKGNRKNMIETQVVEDQTEELPETLQNQLRLEFAEMEDNQTLEAKVIRDADLLEQVFQVKIFQLQGNYDGLDMWLKNVEKHLQTESAKQIFAEATKTSPNEWLKRVRKKEGI